MSLRHPVRDLMLQCDAVCCGLLQCVAVCCSVLRFVAVCCSVLQVCCSVLQCVALWSMIRDMIVGLHDTRHHIAAHAGVLQCVAGVIQCVAGVMPYGL